jgi:hypothetical protein
MSNTGYPPNASPATAAAVSVRRFVNDEIAAGRLDTNDGDEFEFLCECGDLSCDLRITRTLSDFSNSEPGSVVGH